MLNCPHCHESITTYDVICASCEQELPGRVHIAGTDDEEAVKVQLLPCPACGYDHFSWGDVSGDNLNFHREENGLLSRAFMNFSLAARICNVCGYIQLFATRPFGHET